jgi:hypothetical protein
VEAVIQANFGMSYQCAAESLWKTGKKLCKRQAYVHLNLASVTFEEFQRFLYPGVLTALRHIEVRQVVCGYMAQAKKNYLTLVSPEG